MTKSRVKKVRPLDKHILEKLNADVLEEGMSLLFFTALDFCGNIINADPYFHKRPWYDWASVHWEPMNSKYDPFTCPAEVLAFFELSNHTTMDSGLYCVIQSKEYDEKNEDRLMMPLTYGVKEEILHFVYIGQWKHRFK